jgi:hypothetical protein
MKHLLVAPVWRCGAGLALAGALLAAGCSSQTTTTVTTDVCAEVGKIEANADAVAALDGLSPSSAAGVLWVDLKSACVNGQPTPGVSTSWAQLVEEELAALLPSVLPAVAAIL